MKFNEKLFELRKEKGYSQEELADRLNVARQTISKWENGTTTPDFENLIELSKLFEISIDDFVGNDFKQEKIEEINNEDDIILVNKKRKIKKICLIVIAVIFIIAIISLGIKVVKRYKIVNAIYDRLVYKTIYAFEDNRKQEFYFNKRVTKYENLRMKEFEMESCYSKDYNFKKDYSKLEIEPNINGGSPEIIRTEYIDGDDYYDIDNINRTYKKGEYEHEDYYYMAGSELDITVQDELNLDQNKLLIALNPSYNIYIADSGNNHKDYVLSRNGNKDKGINLISITASVSEEVQDIVVYIQEYEKSFADFKSYIYIWCAKEITDEEIKMPDLTGFTFIEK